MGNIDALINAIFYQFMEYIVAPFILVIFNHFVISKEYKQDRLSGFSKELNFVALYSNLLFYFSCYAHRYDADHVCTPNCLCGQIQSALLIVCVFGLILVLIQGRIEEIFKFPYSYRDLKLKKVLDWLWFCIFVLLAVLILGINMHLEHFCFSYHWDDIKRTVYHLFLFFTSPCNFLLLLLAIIVIWILIFASESPYRKNTFKFQELISPEQDPTKNDPVKGIRQQIAIAENKNSKLEVRVQSYYHVAEYYFRNREVESALGYALDYIGKSKTIALSIPYPEIQLLPIRELKMKVHIALGYVDEAKKEIEEVRKKLDGTNGLTRKILERCVEKLQNILSSEY